MATAQDQLILDTIAFIKENWPDIEVDPARIEGWMAEIESGDGRTAEELKSDILTHVVGDERLKQYVSDAFTERGDPAPDQARIDRITSEIISGRTFIEFNETLDGLIGERTPTVDDDAIDPTQSGTGEATGVLSGGTLTRITKPGQEDVWVQVYEYPKGSGKFVAFQYDDYAQVVQANGANPTYGTQNEDWLNDNVSIGGDVQGIVGATGSFDELVEDTIATAVQAAGINDPTTLAAYLADPGIQEVLAQAVLGDWTEEQQLAALRDTPYYYETLYPGLDNFYGMTDNPEAAYAMYVQNTAKNLEALGIPKDADGTYKTSIEQMLDAGVTDEGLASFTPTYLKATGNDTYRLAVNEWLKASGLDPINTVAEMYDLIAGNSIPEINEVVELANLSYFGDEQGLNIAEETIRELGSRTDLSDQEMQQIFSSADKALIALGPKGLRSYNLEQQDILRARANIQGGDGRTVAEMNNLISKVQQELGMADDPTAKIFTDFNREGAPIKKGLGASISEGA